MRLFTNCNRTIGYVLMCYLLPLTLVQKKGKELSKSVKELERWGSNNRPWWQNPDKQWQTCVWVHDTIPNVWVKQRVKHDTQTMTFIYQTPSRSTRGHSIKPQFTETTSSHTYLPTREITNRKQRYNNKTRWIEQQYWYRAQTQHPLLRVVLFTYIPTRHDLSLPGVHSLW